MMEENVLINRSINKWREVRETKNWRSGLSSSNCALCSAFLNGPRRSCVGCPVWRMTGEELCRKTPYEEFQSCFAKNPDEVMLDSIAKKEIEFLKSLKKENKAQKRFIQRLVEEMNEQPRYPELPKEKLRRMEEGMIDPPNILGRKVTIPLSTIKSLIRMIENREKAMIDTMTEFESLLEENKVRKVLDRISQFWTSRKAR